MHLIIFASQPWRIALAAVALSAVMSFVAQGAIKMVEVEGVRTMLLPVVWMIACAVVPFFAFLVSVPSRVGRRADAA